MRSGDIQDPMRYPLRLFADSHTAESVLEPCLIAQIDLVVYDSAGLVPRIHLDSSARECRPVHPEVAHLAAAVDRESSGFGPDGLKLVSHSLIAGMATVAEQTEGVEAAAATVAVAAEDCRCGPAAAVDMLEAGPAGLDLDAADSWHSFVDAVVGHQPAAFLPASS